MTDRRVIGFANEADFRRMARMVQYVEKGALEHPFFRMQRPVDDPESTFALPDGDCSCCPDCFCYPRDPVTACNAIPCLYRTYRIAGKMPFAGEVSLAWLSGCTFQSDDFPVTICNVDYDTFRWTLTIGDGTCGSVLELVKTGTATINIPLKYKSAHCKWNPICGNEMVWVFDCNMPSDIAHLFHQKVCIYPEGPRCKKCPDVITSCCAAGFSQQLLWTFDAHGFGYSCPAIDGQTAVLTFNRAYDSGGGNICYEWVGTTGDVGSGCGVLTVKATICLGCAWFVDIYNQTGSLCLHIGSDFAPASCPMVMETFTPTSSNNNFGVYWVTGDCSCCPTAGQPLVGGTLQPL